MSINGRAAGFLPFLIALVATPAIAQSQVAVTGGTVSGSEAPGGGALIFRGIPYAAPPVGDLRWRAPGPVVPWQGVCADDPDAPACLQNDDGWNHADYVRGSEDCLTLDVRTPGLDRELPVMVWIHGGSNRAGSARGTVLSRITDQNVVLVSINYRLGIFGFLAHRGAAAETGGHAGNYGLMDQIAALKWVRDNIARFGGSPTNITIFGHSAGAQDVTLLLAAPQARSLFHRAIAQSGTPGFGMNFRTLESAFTIGDQADKLLDSGGSIAALRRRSAAALLAADLKLADPGLPDNGFLWLNTVIDGAVLPKSPRELLADGPERPLIVGSNRAEFGGDVTDWDAVLARTFGKSADAAKGFYTADDPRLGSPSLQFGTDWTFRCPAGRVAELVAATGAPVWRYELDLERGGGQSHHSSELPYVFDGLTFDGNVSIQRYWINFAATGDPNGAGLPVWSRFEPKTQRHVLFDVQGVTEDARLRHDICSLLEAL